MSMRTIVIKLHQPSKTKQRIFEEAIINYNKAFQFLVHEAYQEIETIRQDYQSKRGYYRAEKLSKWVNKELSQKLNAFQVQPFKDSLKLELGMCLAGYLRLWEQGRRTRFPKLYDIALLDHKCLEEMDYSVKMRPIYFCRYDTKRSYCLLYDSRKNRYYAKLYLLNRANARPANAPSANSKTLQYIYSGLDQVEPGNIRETFIVVPLAFGRYQEQYLKAALADPSILRTAKFYKSGRDYYLAVSIDQGEPVKIETESYLGVARGRVNELNYSIVDMESHIRKTGTINGKSDRITNSSSCLNAASNEVARMAFLNKSQVIVQNLITFGDNLENARYNCKAYNEFTRMLSYKLLRQGLPAPIKVSSKDLYQRCPQCGYSSGKNRFTKDIFICAQCGASYETEPLGSLNLAEKLLRYHSNKIKIKVRPEIDGSIFTNKLLGLEIFIPNGTDQLRQLKEEINRKLTLLRNSLNDTQENIRTKISILLKFEESEELLDRIEFTVLRKQ